MRHTQTSRRTAYAAVLIRADGLRHAAIQPYVVRVCRHLCPRKPCITVHVSVPIYQPRTDGRLSWLTSSGQFTTKWSPVNSGAATKMSGGYRSGAKVGGTDKFFFLVVPLDFFGSKSTISRFDERGERFCGDQYSLVVFLFAVLGLLLTVTPVPSCL